MKKTNKNTNTGLALGMCFGVSIGTALGSVWGNVVMGMCLGLSIGMALGFMIGSQKDKAVNQQIEERGYTVQTIEQSENEKSYKMTVVSKSGEKTAVNVSSGTMETEAFAVGDVVFLDEDGDVEQAFDKGEE